MIRLFDTDIRGNQQHSSKGNQLKWQKEGTWYKADYAGYEGLAEYVVSGLLRYSNLEKDEYIMYQTEEIAYKDRVYCGCKSQNFLPEGWQLITLERLFQNQHGKSLYKSIFQIEGVHERAGFLTAQAERMTGLKGFGKYLCRVLTVDALFLNEDRHMHNMAVLLDTAGEFHYCPVFDNGCALLSDTTMDYPMNKDIIDLIPQVRSKTLTTDFQEQLDAVESLYGQEMRFHFDEHTITNLLDGEKYYPPEIKRRVRDILLQQRRTYRYLFGNSV